MKRNENASFYYWMGMVYTLLMTWFICAFLLEGWGYPRWYGGVWMGVFFMWFLLRELNGWNREWYTLSLSELLLVTAWFAVGLALYCYEREAAAHKMFEREIEVESQTGAYVLEAHNAAINLSDVIPLLTQGDSTLPRLRQFAPVEKMSREIVNLDAVYQQTASELGGLTLHSKAARDLGRQCRLRAKYMQKLAVEAEKIVRAAQATNARSAETWNRRRTVITSAGNGLNQIVGEIVSSPAIPVRADNERLSEENVRAAAFEAMRWPSLSADQVASIQKRIDTQPHVARILLLDFVILNARADLERRKLDSSERAALNKIRDNRLLKLLLP